LQLDTLKKKQKKKELALKLDDDEQLLAIQNLPFKLTNKQLQAINQINKLNKSNYRESILLQGDVGSGKTIIALLTAMPFITSGHQVAYMAPTEILAQQIFEQSKNIS
jgi:ATP-dependent DNA helicase RecG